MKLRDKSTVCIHPPCVYIHPVHTALCSTRKCIVFTFCSSPSITRYSGGGYSGGNCSSGGCSGGGCSDGGCNGGGFDHFHVDGWKIGLVAIHKWHSDQTAKYTACPVVVIIH